MEISAIVRNSLNQHEVVVSTNNQSKKIDILPKSTGYGSSVNGAELLLLSLATCYCNDIYREASKRNITITSVKVEFFGDFGGEGDPGSNFRYTPIIQSDATQAQLEKLIQDTDVIAEIHKTLRQGIAISLQR